MSLILLLVTPPSRLGLLLIFRMECFEIFLVNQVENILIGPLSLFLHLLMAPFFVWFGWGVFLLMALLYLFLAHDNLS